MKDLFNPAKSQLNHLEVKTSDPQNHKALDIKEKEKSESEALFIKNIKRRKIVAKSKLPNLIVTYDSERADWDSDKLIVRKSHKDYNPATICPREIF